MSILLIACSATKCTAARAPARELYTGALTRKALQLAEKNKWPAFILSGKYGIVKPDWVLYNYDQPAREPFNGPWPRAGGYWVGPKRYFVNVPKRFQPLLYDTALTGNESSRRNGLQSQLAQLNRMLAQ